MKRCETRKVSWAKSLTPGPILIHAAQKWDSELADIARTGPFLEALRSLGVMWHNLSPTPTGRKTPRPDIPFGVLIGVVDIRCCISTDKVQWKPEVDRYFGIDGMSATVIIGSWEKAFGDYSAGRIAVVTEGPVVFPKPIPYTGRQSLFDVPEAVYRDQLAAAAARDRRG